MTSFDSGSVGKVLDRLFLDAETRDPVRMAALPPHGKMAASPAERAEMCGEVYMPVSREVGRFLYLSALARGSRTLVEFGTSFGISTIHLAAAARDIGGGRVITTELHAPKARRARENLTEAGLASYVEIREGDALQTLRNLDDSVDFVLLDGWNSLYLPVFKLIEPRLSARCVIVADDTVRFPEETRPYLDYVRDPRNGFASVPVPMDDGLEFTLRV